MSSNVGKTALNPRLVKRATILAAAQPAPEPEPEPLTGEALYRKLKAEYTAAAVALKERQHQSIVDLVNA